MAPIALSEKVLLIEEALQRGRVPHAFGGALALAYYAVPRATIDIDVNLFVDVHRSDEVLDLLQTLGAEPAPPEERDRLRRDGQARIYWERTPLDLFFSYDAFHESCLERRRVLPFGEGETIHVLSAEDLVVFKVVFDRSKDWRDIDELIYAMADELDLTYLRHWLDRILGSDDPRYRQLDEAITRLA